MEKKTAIQLAIEFITKKNKPVKFADIFKYVKTKQNLTEDQANEIISEFYTQLSTQPNIVCVGDNSWALRDRCAYDSIKVEVEEEIDSDSYDSEDKEDSDGEYDESEEDSESEEEEY